ncbi:MAG: hypothetical protein J5794_05515, partial [Lachnospiraceae bacterium]|nr:hypothetical protein [Lachnospiraceae bacterium]
MKIGWGIREYSMDVPCNLFGQMYMRISKGILDPLCVTALVVEGEETVVFVSVDLEGLSDDLIREAIRAIREKVPAIREDAVLLNATHSHTAMQIWDSNLVTPDGFEIYSPKKIRAHMAHQIAEAVAEAYEKREESGIAFGYGYAVVGHSRRVVYDTDMSEVLPNKVAPNGHAVMYGNTNRPEFLGYEAGADHFVNLMYTFDASDRLTGIVINVPCPSQVSESYDMQSADYWADVREYVHQAYGEDVYVLPQCAAAGDISPRILHYKDAQRRRMALKYNMPYDNTKISENRQGYLNKTMSERKDIAERILNAVQEVYGWAKKDIERDLPVRCLRRTVEIHSRMVSDEEAARCRENIEKYKAMIEEKKRENLPPEVFNKEVAVLRSCINRNNAALERNRTETPDAKMTTVIYA